MVAETRYLPYGEERWITGTLVTDFTFTGQRAEAGFRLMDYNARYYDPWLERFVSADTVVPNPGISIDLNRYAYARNTPLYYQDPNGHAVCEDADCNWLMHPISGRLFNRHGRSWPDAPPLPPSIRNMGAGVVPDTSQQLSERAVRWGTRASMLTVWPFMAANQSRISAFSNFVGPVAKQRPPLTMPDGSTYSSVTKEIELERIGEYTHPSRFARAASKASNFLLTVNAAVNSWEIIDRYSAGQITNSQAGGELLANAGFTGASWGAGAGAAELVAAGTPVGPVAVGLTFLTFDLMVAQGTVNNMIEGQPLSPAVWNARNTTIDTVGGIVGKNHEDWDNLLGSWGIR